MGPVSRPAPLSAPSPRGFGRGTSSVSARRHRVVWSGTARSSPSRPMTEPISPSVCRYASRNTALNVSAVRIARSEYSGCPPRLVRRSASHASTASSENQTVKLPRRRRLSSYSRQFVTLRFCSGMWWRRSWFSLKGKAGIPGQTEGRPATSIGPRVPPVGSLQQRGRDVLQSLDAGLGEEAHEAELHAVLLLEHVLVLIAQAHHRAHVNVVERRQHGGGVLRILQPPRDRLAQLGYAHALFARRVVRRGGRARLGRR